MVDFHIWSLTTVKIPLIRIAAISPLMLTTNCSSPKMPWILYTMQPLSDLSTTVYVYVVFILYLCLLRYEFELKMFDKKPQKFFVSSAYISSIHPLIFKHLIKVDNIETKDSQNTQTQVKEIICNSIWKKIVDSLFYIVIDRVRKRLVDWMISCCFCLWCVRVLLACEHSICIVFYDYVGFLFGFEFKLWMGLYHFKYLLRFVLSGFS